MTKEIAVIEKGKEVDFASVADKLLDMTKGLVEAATPAAKQAYELGMLSLRLDALQIVIIGLVCLGVLVFFSQKIPDMVDDLEKENKWNETCPYSKETSGAFWRLLLTSISIVVLGIISFANLICVWTWVKLFRPELWLVHQAVEKLTN